MMDMGTSVAVSVGIATFGLVALSVIKMFRGNHRRGSNPGSNPGPNDYLPRKEFNVYRQGFEKQLDSMGKSLSKEITLTRDTLVREMEALREIIQK